MHVAILMLSFVAAMQPAEQNMTDNRVPDATLVARAEAAAVMPNGAGPIASYARTYTQARVDGKDMLFGQFIDRRFMEEFARDHHQASPPPIRRVLFDDMIPAFDGGCAILTLFYEIEANAPPRIVCNGGPR